MDEKITNLREFITNIFISMLTGIADLDQNNKIKTNYRNRNMIISFPTLSPNRVIFEYENDYKEQVIEKIFFVENDVYVRYKCLNKTGVIVDGNYVNTYKFGKWTEPDYSKKAIHEIDETVVTDFGKLSDVKKRIKVKS